MWLQPFFECPLKGTASYVQVHNAEHLHIYKVYHKLMLPGAVGLAPGTQEGQ